MIRIPVTMLTLLCLLTAPSCHQPVPAKQTAETVKPPEDSAVLLTNDTAVNFAEQMLADNIWQECYMVVADTGRDYYALRAVLDSIHALTGQKPDTFGRYYDAETDSVILPADEEYELAGKYIPRNGAEVSPAGSIEYLDFYRERGIGNRMLAAVAGMFWNRSEADSVAALVRNRYSGAWVMKTEVYMGSAN